MKHIGSARLHELWRDRHSDADETESNRGPQPLSDETLAAFPERSPAPERLFPTAR